MPLNDRASRGLVFFDRRKALYAFGRGFIIISIIYVSLAIVIFWLMKPAGFVLNNLPVFIVFTMIGAGLCIYMLPLFVASAFVLIQSLFFSPSAISIIDDKLVYISRLYLNLPLNDLKGVEIEVTGRSRWGNILLRIKNGKRRRISLAGISAEKGEVISKLRTLQ